MACLKANSLANLIDGKLSDNDLHDVDRHIDQCVRCRELVVALAKQSIQAEASRANKRSVVSRSVTADDFVAPIITAGAQVGRYSISDVIGVGGMGVVFRATDCELQRDVALKFLHTKQSESQQARLRLEREAQAVAQISHPNVVQVYEVGQLDNQVFVAMELVDGRTLAEWYDEKPSRKELLDVFVRAGRGLAAAHDAGIIHRDFKPDNVLIDYDNRVRVSDFGLAQRLYGQEHAQYHDFGQDIVDELTLTKTGSLIGTPVYMSPEQHRGQRVDERTDIYSFCVSLFELLCGSPPFQATTSSALASQKVQEDINRTPAFKQLPKWLRQTLLRGLRADPEDRFRSISEVVSLLDKKRASKTRVWLEASLSVIALSGVFWTTVMSGKDSHTQLCQTGSEQMSASWSVAHKERLRNGFAKVGTIRAENAATVLEKALNVWAQDWSGMHRLTCEATHVSGEQSDELLDLRMDCLKGKKREFELLLTLLEKPDAKIVEHVSTTIKNLPVIDACADVESLKIANRQPIPEARRQDVASYSDTLKRANAFFAVGDYPKANGLLEPIRDDVKSLGYGPLEARLLLALGKIQAAAGQPKLAEQTLYSAIEASDAAGLDSLRVEAGIEQVRVVGRVMARFEEGLRLARLAEGTLSRLSQPAKYRPELDAIVGAIYALQGNLEQADKRLRSALALNQQTVGHRSSAIASNLAALGNVALFRGDYEQAKESYQAALEIQEEIIGTQHPTTAQYIDNLGIACWSLGEYSVAVEHHRRAVSIQETVLGRMHPSLGVSLINLANAQQMQGSLTDAAVNYRRALEINKTAYGAFHPQVATVHLNLGSVLAEQGNPDEAEAEFEKALKIQKKVLGPDHADVGMSLSSIGLVRADKGRYIEAIDYHNQGLAVMEKALGSKHPYLVESLLGKGSALMALERFREASSVLERALQIGLSHQVAPETLAEVSFALAQALVIINDGSARSRRLAMEAKSIYLEDRARHADQLTVIDKWLDKHAP